MIVGITARAVWTGTRANPMLALVSCNLRGPCPNSKFTSPPRSSSNERFTEVAVVGPSFHRAGVHIVRQQQR
jgi:hypothetical protein